MPFQGAARKLRFASKTGVSVWRNVWRRRRWRFALVAPPAVAYSPWRHDGSWPVFVILGCVALGLIWHVALIATERRKFVYLLYLVLNLFPGFHIMVFCLYLVATEFQGSGQ
jgi:hypothetical protein